MLAAMKRNLAILLIVICGFPIRSKQPVRKIKDVYVCVNVIVSKRAVPSYSLKGVPLTC